MQPFIYVFNMYTEQNQWAFYNHRNALESLGLFFAISLGEKQHVAVAVSLAANICQLTSQFVGYTMLHLKHPQIHPQ